MDAARSALYLPRTKAFPRNTEVEATITLVTGDRPGPLVASVTPTPTTVTVRQHHSFVQLPPPGYTPRRLDPRAGFFGIEVYDYASPFADAAREALHRAPPPPEEGPGGGGVRGRAADRVLRRPRRPGADPQRPRGGRVLVEGGLRDAPGSATPSRCACCPRTRTPWTSATTSSNWVHRSTRGWSYGDGAHRSAHGRDPEGQRHARLAAHPPGRHDRLRPRPALRRPEPGDPGHARSVGLARPSWPSRASASSPRTRSATRWASTTTSRPAPTAAPR